MNEEKHLTELDVGLRQATQAKSELDSFVRTKEWGMLLAFIESQSTLRINNVMTRHKAEANDSEPSQDYVRGEWNGLNLVRVFIEQQLGIAKETVELYKQAVSGQGDD